MTYNRRETQCTQVVDTPFFHIPHPYVKSFPALLLTFQLLAHKTYFVFRELNSRKHYQIILSFIRNKRLRLQSLLPPLLPQPPLKRLLPRLPPPPPCIQNPLVKRTLHPNLREKMPLLYDSSEGFTTPNSIQLSVINQQSVTIQSLHHHFIKKMDEIRE